MPDTPLRPLTDVALATSTAKTLVVSAGAGQIPATPSTLTYDSGTQTLAVGAVAAVPQVNYGTQGGTILAPDPQTLTMAQPRDPAFGKWSAVSYGAMFTSVWDPILYHGYNPNIDTANPGIDTEPTWTYNLEANYFVGGKYTAEAYVEFLSPASDGASRWLVRPWAVTLDKATGSNVFGINIGPSQSGYGRFFIEGGPVASPFNLVNVYSGSSLATSSIQLLAPTLTIGAYTLTDLDGGTSGTIEFGNDGNQANRTLYCPGDELQLGSILKRLHSLNTATGFTIVSDAADGVDAVTINASVTHTGTNKVWKVQNNGSTLVYADPTGLTATNLTSSGTLSVTGATTLNALANLPFSGADGTTVEMVRFQLAGNTGTGNWRNSIYSSLSSNPSSNILKFTLANSQTTQVDVLTLRGDQSTTLAGSLSVGGGAAVSKILPASAVLDFPSVAAGGQQELTISVTGATAGAPVSLGAPAALEAGLVANARVSASGVVTVRVLNITASPIDPASATYACTVFNP